MRISLKESLAMIAGAAVFFWCAAEARFDNAMFWIAAVIMGVVGYVFVKFANTDRARWVTLLLSPAAMFLCAFPFASSSLLLYFALLFLAGFVVTVMPRQPVRVLLRVVSLCILVAFIGAVYEGRKRLRELEAMRDAYPVESLADRLAYEVRPVAVQVKTNSVLSSKASQELSELERRPKHSYREWSLQRIHQRQYELFARSAGFGVGRMRQPSMRAMEAATLRDIAFADSPTESDGSPYGNWRNADRPELVEDAKAFHRALRDDFVDPDGFGAVLKRLDEVVGFVPHAAHFAPVSYLKNAANWTLERLELVSLLKFPEPRVYVLDHLPRMDQLASNNAPTRPLDEFEKPALDRLRTDEDVVIEERDGQTRMLGSLRAANQCLDCHSVPRGELLGAFTYILHRVPRDIGGE